MIFCKSRSSFWQKKTTEFFSVRKLHFSFLHNSFFQGNKNSFKMTRPSSPSNINVAAQKKNFLVIFFAITNQFLSFCATENITLFQIAQNAYWDRILISIDMSKHTMISKQVGM